MISNQEFLQTIFSDDSIWAHVTSFYDDPMAIPENDRGRCWGGNYFSRINLLPMSNQYFTISTFFADDTGKARRRKALFRATHVIVADDVREKLDVIQVEKLPPPSYKLQTSPGSEQWGWILDQACQDRLMVENLLDGLVEKGLSPDGKDPGMKGVTRYVRLPEGVNTKASKLVNGIPQQCIMLEWSPWQRVSIQSLANTFGINLNAQRRETKDDGATEINDHPIVDIPDTIHIKSVRSAGRYDITCPWVNDHTGMADDGAAIFTNNDGSIGFKCHHGNCEHRTGKDLLEFIERNEPGFGERLKQWQIMREFQKKPVFNFMRTSPAQSFNFMGQSTPDPTAVADYNELIAELRTMPYSSPEATTQAYMVLKGVDTLDHGTRLAYWDQIRDHMQWSKQDLNIIVNQQREHWYKKTINDDFYKNFVYVSEQNQFYNPWKRLWLSPEAFQNTHGHLDETARSEALICGRVEKVDRFDYAPGMPQIYTEGNVKFVNGWSDDIEKGIPGEVAWWLNHFDILGWSEHRGHILKWMAFTLRRPELKINHILLLGGGEGNGKDFLLYPLSRAMGQNSTIVSGEELLRDFNDYTLTTKYLHVNETELGDRREADAIANRLKPLAACPPYTLRCNQKGIRPIAVRNVVNVSMTTNGALPIRVKGDSRRFYPVWTELSIRGYDGQVTPEWKKYWIDRWTWIRDQDGWKACVYYLMNCVDISDFDPGTAPPVTDFLRDMQEASEDPVVTAIKEFTKLQLSYFKSDLLTAKDIHDSLKTIGMNNLGIDLKYVPSQHTIGKIMKQNGLGRSMRARKGRSEIRLWSVRNFEFYAHMPGTDVYDEYHRTMNNIKTTAGLQVAK